MKLSVGEAWSNPPVNEGGTNICTIGAVAAAAVYIFGGELLACAACRYIDRQRPVRDAAMRILPHHPRSMSNLSPSASPSASQPHFRDVPYPYTIGVPSLDLINFTTRSLVVSFPLHARQCRPLDLLT